MNMKLYAIIIFKEGNYVKGERYHIDEKRKTGFLKFCGNKKNVSHVNFYNRETRKFLEQIK